MNNNAAQVGRPTNASTPLLNEFALAEMLAVSVATIRRWRLLKQGPKFLKLGAAVRYRPEDIKAWLESLPTGGGVQ